MHAIDIDKIACPNCGVSGAGNLNADAQIEHTGYADGKSWVSCPNCGNYVDFDAETGQVLDADGEAFQWAVSIISAMEHLSTADLQAPAMGTPPCPECEG